MKIYDFPFAPNPQKLRVYLVEKGLEIPLVSVNLLDGEQRRPDFLKKNPMGGLPVLELDDGSCLSESLAIIEYLEELYPDPPMMGTNPLERARIRRLERIAELSVMSRTARIFFHTSPVFAGRRQLPEVAAEARESLPDVLTVLDAEIGDRPFVAGERPSIADCTLFAALEHGKRASIDLDPHFKNLTRWYEAFSQRRSARA